MKPIVTHRTPMNVLAARVQPAKDKLAELADMARPAAEALLQFARFFTREKQPASDDGPSLQAPAPSNDS